ncbi:MAG: hypothetical protein NZ961_03740 [Candidatus Poribacteria bacterium]|nr:hypothetical protein [Candidatus Poribacteria bacterium]
MSIKLFMILILVTSLGISSASAQTGITVETNFGVFQQGQAIMITGNAEEKSIAIQVKDPTGISILIRTLEADSGGNFNLEFRIPQTATLGDYQVVASMVVDDVPIINTTTFEVVEKGEKAEQIAKEKKGGGCLIATAAFGSEMAPQIQFLRELRDNTVLQTESGTLFMAGFNQFYYSFSPAIADYERENPVFKEAVKLTLTPLLTSLALLQYTDIDSEPEMLGYGIGIILLNIGMYFVAPAVLIMKVRKRI